MSEFAAYAEVNDYWPNEKSLDMEGMLDKWTSRKFHDMMDNRMLVSHYKYGDSRLGYPDKSKAIDNIEVRLQRYRESGNAEWLVDAANFCMLEFMHPSIPNAFLEGTDSEQSPGILYADGTFAHGKHEEKS